MHCRRLPLEGLKNARDLGGYAVPGGVTRFGVFIRSEVPSELTASDIAFLQDYGLATAIDFRSGEEVGLKPSLLREAEFVETLHLPMFDERAAQGAGPRVARAITSDFKWGEHYITMCETHKSWIKGVLEAMAAARGAVLFHCTTGKDRTGIITAMLLGLCGADDRDIAADYCVSEIYLREFYKRMTAFVPQAFRQTNYDPEFFSTSHVNMFTLLNHFNTEYGGIRSFLTSCGVGEDTLAALYEKLVSKNLWQKPNNILQ